MFHTLKCVVSVKHFDMTIILAFLLLYFYSYISQIRRNKEEIDQVNEDLEKLKNQIVNNEKLLNTLESVILIRRKSK